MSKHINGFLIFAKEERNLSDHTITAYKSDLEKFYKYLKRKQVKICLVSPELVEKGRESEIKKLVNNLKKNKFNVNAVCTKKPNLWKNLMNEK